MKLWWFEVKKMLFTQRGLWILILCLVLKTVFLFAFPEMKDQRILLSQKQYDKYLELLHGENTPEKSTFIITEYLSCKQTIDSKETMERQYQRGELSEEEWRAYAQALNDAYLHQNAAKIFSEKAEQFLVHPQNIPPAHYIYEYGWQTVFTLQKFPDIFLLFGILLLTAQCFSSEAAGGMLPVLLAARNGRRHLFGAKLLALLTVSFVAACLSGAVEAAVFWLRGWCNDSGVPLYSITLFAKCPLDMSLWEGYALSLAVRTITILLFAGMFYGVSVWLKNTTNLMFLALCVLVVPILFGGAFLLFTHSGLLCGSGMLLLLGEYEISAFLPIGIVTVYSFTVICFAEKRYRKGL